MGSPVQITLAGACPFIVPDTALFGDGTQGANVSGASSTEGGAGPNCVASGVPGLGAFEMACASGLVLWGEAWAGSGVFVIDGAAAVMYVREGGEPFLDVYVPGGSHAVAGMAGMRHEMRVPAIEVMAVASMEEAHSDYNAELRSHVARLNSGRILN